MHHKFDHKEIEEKWQKRWRQDDIYRTKESDKPKTYVLDMFPYPSGEGLHVGHPKGYIATDVYSRFKRMTGHEVLHPMGWDAFGLPAENFAIKHKVHPREAVERNIANFKRQLGLLGFDYDWSREINTTDPEYYKWTQWIFVQLFKKGLAYESFEPINWCPGCQTGLANEDVEPDGTCERCDSRVEKRPMRQWVLKIRQYADRMLEDLDTLAWPEHIKEAQRNWIGKSEGAELDFTLSTGDTVTVFTTRPDTLFGATYMVLAPEHELIQKNKKKIENWEEVASYIEAAAVKKEMDRLDETREKTGVKLEGVTATNPGSDEEIPVYIADYVLASYGTGAIMAVPAHDERDYVFAKTYDVPVTQVVVPCADDAGNPPQPELPEVTRDTVIVHLRDRSTGKYALLDWHGSLEGITTAIMGGIEDGQTPEEAALAEIQEETAIPNAKIIKTGKWVSAARYCASHKGENRKAHAYALLAEVDDLSKQGTIPKEETEKHTLVWVDEKDVEARLVPAHQKTVWQAIHSDVPLTGSGYLMNSGEFTGMDSEEAKAAITKKVGGRLTATYKIRDWVFSRQRYWGEPIPIIHCQKCGPVAVPEEELPVTLPEVEHYEPAGTGESPLATIDEWVNTSCPSCGEKAKRETNTMPQWAGSSWYYLRFMDPHNDEALVDPEKEKYWAPVDVYVGGDHAVRHLIYARFWHKFLYDIGAVSTVEPFQRLEFLGFILAEDGRKMSKRWGNVISPDDIVDLVGADTLRVYEMFMGPFENTIAWSQDGLAGARRFLEHVNGLAGHITDSEPETVTRQLHKTIAKVGADIEEFKFNTAVSSMMIFVNTAEKGGLSRRSYTTFLQLLAPFAPHLTEELWAGAGESGSIHQSTFPEADSTLLVDESVTIGVQINGKHRGEITVAADADEAAALSAMRENPALAERVGDAPPKRVIYVPGRILNIIL